MAAQAQQFAPISDRILSDPTYLPLQGQIYGQTSYAYGASTGDSADATGTAFSRGWSNTYSQALAYGVTNRLSVNLGFDYATDHSRDTARDGLVSVTGSQGFSDPSFGAAYRLIDQTDHPFSLDLKGEIAPDLLPAKSPVGTSDGTVAAGGWNGDIGLAIGRETKMFTIQARLTGRWMGASTLEDRDTGSTIRSSSYWVPTVGLATQTRLTPRLSVNVSGAYDLQGSPGVLDEANGLFHRVNLGNTGDLGVAVNYHFLPNRLVGSLSYDHGFFAHSDTVYPTEPALDSVINRGANIFGATVRYTFR